MSRRFHRVAFGWGWRQLLSRFGETKACCQAIPGSPSWIGSPQNILRFILSFLRATALFPFFARTRQHRSSQGSLLLYDHCCPYTTTPLFPLSKQITSNHDMQNRASERANINESWGASTWQMISFRINNNKEAYKMKCLMAVTTEETAGRGGPHNNHK